MPVDTEYEVNLLKALWDAGRRDLISADMFADPSLRLVASRIRALWDEYGERPDGPSVRAGLKEQSAVEALDRVLRAAPPAAYYIAQADDYARRVALYRGLEAALSTLFERGYDAGVNEARRALSAAAGQPDGVQRTSLQDYLRRNGLQRGPARVATGFPSLDTVTGGGLGAGELGVVVAVLNRGKSSFLTQLGMRSVVAGLHVVHVTCENTQWMVAQRYAACYGSTSPDEWDRLPGRLYIEYRPTKTLTLLELERLVAAGKCDLLIVDYAALLRVSASRPERRFELADIFEGLRRIAGERSIPVWTAAQANRLGFYRQRDNSGAVLDVGDLAECWEIGALVDLMVTLNTTPGEAVGTLYVAKNRIGPAGCVIPLDIDWARARFRERKV